MLAEETHTALRKAPASLAEFANKQMPFGLFEGIIADVNTTPWQALRRNGRKTWIYAGVFNERYYTGFAIADAGLVATAFAYVFDAQTQRYVEEKATVPFVFAALVVTGLLSLRNLVPKFVVFMRAWRLRPELVTDRSIEALFSGVFANCDFLAVK